MTKIKLTMDKSNGVEVIRGTCAMLEGNYRIDALLINTLETGYRVLDIGRASPKPQQIQFRKQRGRAGR